MTNVLLTNGLLRKTLCCVRSLGHAGIGTVVSETAFPNVAAWSRHCRKALRSPNPANTAQYLAWLQHTLAEGNFAAFIPMDDDVMDVVVPAQQELRRLTHVLLPPPDAYEVFRDKRNAARAAREFGFTVPKELRMQDKWFPAVVKETRNSGSRGLYFVQTEADWQKIPVHGDVFVQEQIPHGEKIDVCLLFNDESRPVAGFVQKELRHYPLSYGPSSVQVSIHDKELLQACIRFATRYQWRGVIEFEFMARGDSGELYFMEANPRFWNSLYLAVLAGVDFPLLYYRAAVGESVQPCHSYRENVMCRNLIPSDLLHFFANRKRFSLTPSFFARYHDDVLSLSDIMPTFGYAVASIVFAADRRKRRSVIR